jgi:pheophorbide a oxygenase
MSVAVVLLLGTSAVRLPTPTSPRSAAPPRMVASVQPAVVSTLTNAGAWPLAWAPIASTGELDPERPTPVRFMGGRYVVWQDNDGVWHVFADACPHRLAPLSEGRIDRATGNLECAYHGWQFSSAGACERIPQAPDKVADASCGSARACVAAHATRIEKGVLFFWPEAGAAPRDDELPPEYLPAHMLSSVAEGASTYTRDLPYGWDTLVENLVDPSHIPFAHHGLQGKREDAIPINLTLTHEDAHGFEFEFADRTMGRRRAGSGGFKAPYVVQYQVRSMLRPPPAPRA